MMNSNLIIIVILPPYMELFKGLRPHLGINFEILRFNELTNYLSFYCHVTRPGCCNERMQPVFAACRSISRVGNIRKMNRAGRSPRPCSFFGILFLFVPLVFKVLEVVLKGLKFVFFTTPFVPPQRLAICLANHARRQISADKNSLDALHPCFYLRLTFICG